MQLDTRKAQEAEEAAAKPLKKREAKDALERIHRENTLGNIKTLEGGYCNNEYVIVN